MTEIPTSGDVLAWARKFRGLTPETAAERLRIPVEDVLAFEANEKFPTKTIFVDMGAKYRIPLATLFRRTPPPEPKRVADFRSLEGMAKDVRSFEFNVALSNVRTLAFLAGRVAMDDEDFVPPDLPLLSVTDDPDLAGEQERRRLGVSVADQFSWKDAGDAYARWRAHLEHQGVIVFQQSFPLVDGRGFSLFDNPAVPIAVVNKEESAETARSFTLWHEYAHLLLRRPGISDQGDEPIEEFCNRFAAAFLIPTDALRELVSNWPNQPVEWPDSIVSDWARRLKVSRYALAIRLEQRGLAPAGFGRRFRFVSATKPRVERDDSKPSQVRIRMSELGGSYLGRVLTALDRRAIDDVQFVEAVGLAPERIADVRDYVERSRRRVSGG